MTPTYRPELPPRPPRIAELPLDPRGYPIPWFVAWIDGRPEFRTASAEKWMTAYRQRRCWVCGQHTRGDEAFVIGPMCIINRISAEPPSHLECAVYSAQACPFLTKPHMVRREEGMPENCGNGAGIMIKRNPGAAAVWVTSDYKPIADPKGKGFVLQIGDPTGVRWFAEGRDATRAEVVASIESGVPILLAAEEQASGGDLAHMIDVRSELDRLTANAMAYLPA
jgi:hypothetical protein